MHILLSNDDGVFAKGLQTLYDALKDDHELTVVAPDRNHSGASHSLTIDQPLRTHQLDNGFHAVTGTPSDCMQVAFHKILTKKPDLVIAGINHGANLGDDVIYSGTVAAAREGRLLGCPSIAVSLASRRNESSKIKHFKTAATVIKALLTKDLQWLIQQPSILNINVPNVLPADLQGVHMTKLGQRRRDEVLIDDTDPHGEEIVWLGPPPPSTNVDADTDFFAVKRGFVSMTPVLVDQTAYNLVEPLSEWADTQSLDQLLFGL